MLLVLKSYELKMKVLEPKGRLAIYQSVNQFRENYNDIKSKIDNKI